MVSLNRQLLLSMAIGVMIVLPIVGYIIHLIDRRDKIHKNYSATIYLKNSKRDITHRMYIFLCRISIAKNYLDRISRRYEILFPGDQRMIVAKTMQAAITSWIFCILGISIVFSTNLSLMNTAIASLIIVVIDCEVTRFLLKSLEIKLLEELSVFVSDIRHNYHVNRMVDDAILLSMDGLGYEMRVHAKKLYDTITSNNLKEDVLKYNTTIHNKYLKTLLSLCINVLEFSDKRINGQSLFTSNLDNLKKEINIEILKQRKLRYLFSGVSFVTIFPCLTLELIRKFGISMLPELDSFYNGRPGIVFAASILVVTTIIYILNNKLKETKDFIPKRYDYLKRLESIRLIRKALDNYTDKFYGKMLVLKDELKRLGETITARQLLLQRLLFSILTFFMVLTFQVYIHENNRSNIVSKVNTISFLTPTNNQNQIELVKETLLRYVNQFKDSDEANFILYEKIYDAITKERRIHSSKLSESIAKEVLNRVEKYRNEYYKWHELLLCIGISIIAYYIPYWMILYKKKILQMNMEDEVNQFNSIIYMLMYHDHITVKDLLEELELFAVVFKKSLQECINDYNRGDIEALTHMKENESFPPFRRMVDNLIRCDMIPIELAFDEIASDRESYHDRRKLENEISLQKRSDIAKPLSFIPMVLVMIYLIIPLVMESLKELNSFSETIQNI